MREVREVHMSSIAPVPDTETELHRLETCQRQQSDPSCSGVKCVVTAARHGLSSQNDEIKLGTFFWTTVELCTWIIWPIIILEFAAARTVHARLGSAAHLILTLETKLANFPGLGWIWVIVILSVLTEHHTVSSPLIGPDLGLEPSDWLTFCTASSSE